VTIYLVFRADKRFHIPDGSKGPGDYVGKARAKGNKRFSLRFADEEVFFDFGTWREEGMGELEMAAAWANKLKAELEGRFERLEKEDEV